MNENVSGDRYSLRHAKFPIFLLSLHFLGVSGDVTEKIEITLKIVIYSFILAV